MPKYVDLIEFLRAEASRLQSSSSVKDAGQTSSNKNHPQKQNSQKSSNPKQTFTAQASHNCYACGEEGHPVYKCPKLLNLNVQERIMLIKKENLCFNCLRKGHRVNVCTSSNCRKCGKAHNTLVHLDKEDNKSTEQMNNE